MSLFDDLLGAAMDYERRTERRVESNLRHMSNDRSLSDAQREHYRQGADELRSRCIAEERAAREARMQRDWDSDED